MPESLVAIAAATRAADSNVALFTFSIYLVLVMILAWLSSRAAPAGGFISEYFLGSRNLGVWAFALTFAATSAFRRKLRRISCIDLYARLGPGAVDFGLHDCAHRGDGLTRKTAQSD